MIVYINNENYFYDIENLVAIFILKSQLSFTAKIDEYFLALKSGQDAIKIEIEDSESFNIEFFYGGNIETKSFTASKELFKRSLKKELYIILEGKYKPLSSWGILVGIRPVKIVHEFLDRGLSVSQIKKCLSEDYLIHEEKIELLLEIAIKERPYLYPVEKNKISVYICIPFCPSRCLYCSFPSNSLEKKSKLVHLYLEKLLLEIKESFEWINTNGMIIDCIYIGGGTPTSLNHNQMELLLKAISENTDLSLVREFTVEAGRPDTVDREKLECLKKYGVDRICVNPQTMNDETLVSIGRRHTSEDIEAMMSIARDIGFKCINMDVIMGLPGEDLSHAKKTMRLISKLEPENVTVHTLSIKRASRLNEESALYELAHDAVVEDMIKFSEKELRSNGLSPYYMYRQKKMIGHLENVGYSLEGFESLYNMRIMEERHTIIALGAGAVSKICFPEENRFERVANFKGVEEYISRFDEILDSKRFDIILK